MSSTTSLRKSRRHHERPENPKPLRTLNPRALKPSIPPPAALLLYPPILPEDVRKSSQSDTIRKYFDVSTHVVPAAYPRLTPYVTFSELERKAGGFAGTETKESRSLRANQIAEQLMKLRDDSAKAKLPLDGSENRLLWNVVNRYSRRDTLEGTHSNRRRVTLLLAHANGFPRETWEPFLAQLCLKLEGRDVLVDEVWAIEAVQHGDSGLINQDKLGVLFDWSDHSRDLLNFLLNYMPDRSSSAPSPPLHLPRLPEEIGHERIKSGFSDRTLIAIGHSFGGCTSTLAAVNVPKLFSSLVLVDPVIVPQYNDRTPDVLHLARGALQRREKWSSREEAYKLFRNSPFFGAWDPKVLELFVDHGLVAEDGGVRLKMPGLQESVVFVDMQVSYETFELLERLDNSVSLLWILVTKGHKLNAPEDERHLVWRRPANCENVCIGSSGHLIAQEAPTELAHEISVFLLEKYACGPEVRRSKL